MTEASLIVSEKADVDGSRERSDVQPIERAFALLTLIARNLGISLAEPLKKVGLHNSTSFYPVCSLVAVSTAHSIFLTVTGLSRCSACGTLRKVPGRCGW